MIYIISTFLTEPFKQQSIYNPNRMFYSSFFFLPFFSVLNSITSIETISPIGVVKSPVGYLKPRHYYVNITWTPDLPSQYGENILCFTAEDSVG